MDVLNTITINDVTYPVDNQTDYYFDGQLNCSYGFTLEFKQRRGVDQYRWSNLLARHNFDKPTDLTPVRRGVWTSDSKSKELNIAEFISRPFYLSWTLGDTWYGLLFDGREFILQDNNGNENLNQFL